MFTFRNVLMKQKKKHKQSLESAQYGLEIIFKDREPQKPYPIPWDIPM